MEAPIYSAEGLLAHARKTLSVTSPSLCPTPEQRDRLLTAMGANTLCHVRATRTPEMCANDMLLMDPAMLAAAAPSANGFVTVTLLDTPAGSRGERPREAYLVSPIASRANSATRAPSRSRSSTSLGSTQMTATTGVCGAPLHGNHVMAPMTPIVTCRVSSKQWPRAACTEGELQYFREAVVVPLHTMRLLGAEEGAAVRLDTTDASKVAPAASVLLSFTAGGVGEELSFDTYLRNYIAPFFLRRRRAISVGEEFELKNGKHGELHFTVTAIDDGESNCGIVTDGTRVRLVVQAEAPPQMQGRGSVGSIPEHLSTRRQGSLGGATPPRPRQTERSACRSDSDMSPHPTIALPPRSRQTEESERHKGRGAVRLHEPSPTRARSSDTARAPLPTYTPQSLEMGLRITLVPPPLLQAAFGSQFKDGSSCDLPGENGGSEQQEVQTVPAISPPQADSHVSAIGLEGPMGEKKSLEGRDEDERASSTHHFRPPGTAICEEQFLSPGSQMNVCDTASQIASPLTGKDSLGDTSFIGNGRSHPLQPLVFVSDTATQCNMSKDAMPSPPPPPPLASLVAAQVGQKDFATGPMTPPPTLLPPTPTPPPTPPIHPQQPIAVEAAADETATTGSVTPPQDKEIQVDDLMENANKEEDEVKDRVTQDLSPERQDCEGTLEPDDVPDEDGLITQTSVHEESANLPPPVTQCDAGAQCETSNASVRSVGVQNEKLCQQDTATGPMTPPPEVEECKSSAHTSQLPEKDEEKKKETEFIDDSNNNNNNTNQEESTLYEDGEEEKVLDEEDVQEEYIEEEEVKDVLVEEEDEEEEEAEGYDDEVEGLNEDDYNHHEEDEEVEVEPNASREWEPRSTSEAVGMSPQDAFMEGNRIVETWLTVKAKWNELPIDPLLQREPYVVIKSFQHFLAIYKELKQRHADYLAYLDSPYGHTMRGEMVVRISLLTVSGAIETDDNTSVHRDVGVVRMEKAHNIQQRAASRNTKQWVEAGESGSFLGSDSEAPSVAKANEMLHVSLNEVRAALGRDVIHMFRVGSTRPALYCTLVAPYTDGPMNILLRGESCPVEVLKTTILEDICEARDESRREWVELSSQWAEVVSSVLRLGVFGRHLQTVRELFWELAILLRSPGVVRHSAKYQRSISQEYQMQRQQYLREGLGAATLRSHSAPTPPVGGTQRLACHEDLLPYLQELQDTYYLFSELLEPFALQSLHQMDIVAAITDVGQCDQMMDFLQVSYHAQVSEEEVNEAGGIVPLSATEAERKAYAALVSARKAGAIISLPSEWWEPIIDTTNAQGKENSAM